MQLFSYKTYLYKKLCDVRARADERDTVALFNNVITAGDNYVVPSLCCADEGVGIILALEFDKRLVDKRVTLADMYLNDLHLSLREFFDLHRRGKTDKSSCLASRLVFGVDYNVNSKGRIHKALLIQISRVSYARDRVLCAKALCHHTAKKIELVPARYRYNDVCCFDPRIAQSINRCTASANTSDIIFVDDGVYNVLVLIYYDYTVVLSADILDK